MIINGCPYGCVDAATARAWSRTHAPRSVRLSCVHCARELSSVLLTIREYCAFVYWPLIPSNQHIYYSGVRSGRTCVRNLRTSTRLCSGVTSGGPSDVPEVRWLQCLGISNRNCIAARQSWRSLGRTPNAFPINPESFVDTHTQANNTLLSFFGARCFPCVPKSNQHLMRPPRMQHKGHIPH